jgi:hypothetical protein
MIVMSSAATSRKASGSIGVAWPAKTYAAHIPIQTKARPAATNKS